MIVGDIIASARQTLMDAATPYHWGDPILISAVMDGCREIKLRRPDLLLQSNGTMGTLSTLTALTDTVPYPDEHKDALAHYAVSRALSEENPDTQAQAKADWHYKRFREALGV
jgi:hypothetical protein